MQDYRDVFRATDLPENGVLTGKFAPLTSGHINFIHLAATQVQKLWVVLSFDQKWIDALPNKKYWGHRLSLENRVKWLKRTFADMPHIKIIYVDETNIATYPEGEKDWSVLVRKELNRQGCVSIDRWFSSEPEYSRWIDRYFPEARHVIIDQDRVGVPISATMVRENPYKHWGYLPSVVREECVLKVLINGVESCAKSTLTRQLAKVFNTAWVEEYGRTFCEVDLAGDEIALRLEHYGQIAMRRLEMERAEYARANQVLFCDTSALVTQMFCKAYEDDRSPIVDAIIPLEQYDIVLDLASDIEWVDDGLRGQSGGTEKLTRNRQYLTDLMIEFDTYRKSAVYPISGSFNQRLMTASKIVHVYLNRGICPDDQSGLTFSDISDVPQLFAPAGWYLQPADVPTSGVGDYTLANWSMKNITNDNFEPNQLKASFKLYDGAVLTTRLPKTSISATSLGGVPQLRPTPEKITIDRNLSLLCGTTIADLTAVLGPSNWPKEGSRVIFDDAEAVYLGGEWVVAK
jgi:HTH-type transcriptional repressor of NAD biosynthesis genes